MGRSTPPSSEALLSDSQVKRLELRDGANKLKVLAAVRELNPKLLPFTPKPGTQQDLSLQNGSSAIIFSEVTRSILSSLGDEELRLTGLIVLYVLQKSVDDAEAHAQDDRTRSSSISEVFLKGQQPVAQGDKHLPRLRPMQAQPVKRVTKAVSDAGAGERNNRIRT